MENNHVGYLVARIDTEDCCVVGTKDCGLRVVDKVILMFSYNAKFDAAKIEFPADN